MDIYDDSPINKAHYFYRKAENLTKKGLFDKASECHAVAATALEEALKLTNNKVALESIELQRQFHIKNQEILRLKKLQLLAIQEAARVRREVMSRVRSNSKKSESDDCNGTLQKAIYRNFEEADSLFELLVNKKEVDGEKPAVESAQISSTSGSKRPKDDSTVIEELRIVNYQLRSLITQLMTELAASEKERLALKKRVAELEGSSVKATSSQSPATSSCEELAADLPPLDLPCFHVGGSS